jgi:hypothetical protein
VRAYYNYSNNTSGDSGSIGNYTIPFQYTQPGKPTLTSTFGNYSITASTDDTSNKNCLNFNSNVTSETTNTITFTSIATGTVTSYQVFINSIYYTTITGSSPATLTMTNVPNITTQDNNFTVVAYNQTTPSPTSFFLLCSKVDFTITGFSFAPGSSNYTLTFKTFASCRAYVSVYIYYDNDIIIDAQSTQNALGVSNVSPSRTYTYSSSFQRPSSGTHYLHVFLNDISGERSHYYYQFTT